MFDNNFDTKSRLQLRLEVEDASSNEFVGPCDPLRSNLFHKVSRVGVLWIMYVHQCVKSGASPTECGDTPGWQIVRFVRNKVRDVSCLPAEGTLKAEESGS